MSVKKVLYNCTVILPIIGKIVSLISLIKELVESNKAVVIAQQRLSDDIKIIEKLEQEYEAFNRSFEDD